MTNSISGMNEQRFVMKGALSDQGPKGLAVTFLVVELLIFETFMYILSSSKIRCLTANSSLKIRNLTTKNGLSYLGTMSNFLFLNVLRIILKQSILIF